MTDDKSNEELIEVREITKKELAEQYLNDARPDFWRAVCWTEGFRTLLEGAENECRNAGLNHQRQTGHQTSIDHIT